MKLSWHWQDYVFAGGMTAGMVVSALVIPMLAPQFLELVFWAPLGGIFLTLGMARLQCRGSIAVMILPLAIVLALLSPLIGGYLTLTCLLTEAIIFFIGNYRTKRNRLIGNVVFFTLALVIGYITAAFLVGNEFARLLNQPLRFAGLIIAAGIAGSLGWRLGELVLSQLKRMGKWKTES
jgi:energy-coupling factor transport system substrate-specific component